MVVLLLHVLYPYATPLPGLVVLPCPFCLVSCPTIRDDVSYLFVFGAIDDTTSMRVLPATRLLASRQPTMLEDYGFPGSLESTHAPPDGRGSIVI